MELSPLVLHQWTGLQSHWVQVLQNLYPVCFFLPYFLQFEELIHGISQSNRLNPHFVKIEILRHFSVCPTLKISSDARYCLVNFMRSPKVLTFMEITLVRTQHDLKNFVSLVNTAHKSGQSDVSHLTFQSRLSTSCSLCRWIHWLLSQP